MDGYRVWFVEKGKAVLQPFSVREPKSDEVQVKVDFTLISAGTEKAYLSGANNTAHKFPTCPGYSGVGTVVKTGDNVKGLEAGSRVFVAWGGHGSYNIVHKKNCFLIPDSVSSEEAVFTRLAGFPLLALRRSGIEMGASVGVVGLGMLGLFAVQLASLYAVPLIAVGNREIRRQKALDFGADYCFAPDTPDLTQKIQDICEEKNGIRGGNVIIETSGQIDALNSCLTYTTKYGRVMLNGCNRVTDQPIDLYRYIHLKGVELIGAHDGTRLPYNSAPRRWTARRDYITVLRFMESGRLNARDMLNEIVSPREIPDVYNRLLYDKEFPLGVIFDWREFHQG